MVFIFSHKNKLLIKKNKIYNEYKYELNLYLRTCIMIILYIIQNRIKHVFI